MNKPETTPVQIAIRIVIIIIVLAVLLLVSFAMVRFVPKVLSSLSYFRNIFGEKELLVLSLDQKTIPQSGNAGLSLTQTNGKSEGQYELSFSCAKIDSDTRLRVIKDNISDTLECEKILVLPFSPSASTTENMTLQHVGENISYDQPMTVSIKHTSASSTLASGAIVLTILGEENTATTPEPTKPATSTSSTPATSTSKPTTSYSPSPTYYAPQTPAQLIATLKNVSVDRNDKATITFFVTNVGGTNSGNWTFSSVLPRDGQTRYNSPAQSSIPPQGSSIMTLSFDDAESGTIYIYVQNSTLTAKIK